MSFPLIVDGNSYQYPSQGDKANTGWGSQTGGWASAVTLALTKLGLGGTLSPLANAVIDISSTSKGILIPRMTTAQRNAITSPENSLLIFNTDLKVVQYYDLSVTQWISVGARLPDNAIFSGTLTVNGNIIGLGSLTLSGGIQGTIGTFSSKILTGDGSVSEPVVSLSSESNSGLYKIATNKLGIAINGSRVGEFGVGYGGFTGNIIQVVSSTTSIEVSNSSNTTWLDSNLSCSITPKYNNSKIMIFIYQGTYLTSVNSGAYRLLRDSTVILTNGYFVSGNNLLNASPMIFLDTISSNSLITYKTQFKMQNGGTGTFYMNYDDGSGDQESVIILAEVQQ